MKTFLVTYRRPGFASVETIEIDAPSRSAALREFVAYSRECERAGEPRPVRERCDEA